MRQKCIKRQCLLLSRILYMEDPLQKVSSSPALQQDMAAELRAAGSTALLEGPSVGTQVATPPQDQGKL